MHKYVKRLIYFEIGGINMQSDFKFIEGGVSASVGFTANGVLNHIKANRTTYDTALIMSERICNAVGMFTQNRVKAECVKLTKDYISDGKAQAIIVNSGNANACTGEEGYKNAQKEAECVGNALEINPKNVLV